MELLAPAGSLEKLKVAVSYGADAVYLGAQQFNLRQAANNFTQDELIEGVEFVKTHGSQAYIVLNSFLHQSDLEDLPALVGFLDGLKVDAYIVSDLGVIKAISAISDTPIHLSTQASCLNVYSAKLWKKMGVSRVILGREASLLDAKKIKEATGLEVEMFIHGAMCMAYSGNCTISNFTAGRDSNRGGCAQSCRFEYSLDFSKHAVSEKAKENAFFMSSKDLQGLALIPEFAQAGIDSIKVEGRMKSHLYAGTIAKVYSKALNYYKTYQNLPSAVIAECEDELNKFTHRSYTDANLIEKADSSSIYDERVHGSEASYVIAGNIIDVIENDSVLVEVRNAFTLNDKIEILPFENDVNEIKDFWIKDVYYNNMERTKPNQLVRLPYIDGAKQWNLIRMQVHQ